LTIFIQFSKTNIFPVFAKSQLEFSAASNQISASSLKNFLELNCNVSGFSIVKEKFEHEKKVKIAYTYGAGRPQSVYKVSLAACASL